MNIISTKSVKFAVALCAAGLFFTAGQTARADNPHAARDYVRDAYQEVIGDAAINRIARVKGEHEEVRHYAAERVKLDERMEKELRDMADRRHIGVVGRDELARSAQDRLDRIQNAEHFDREYLGGEVEDSEVMTKLFANARDAETDPELHDWFVDKAHSLKDRNEEVKTLDERFDR